MATKEEADRVLHAHRSWKACYPCAKRKVKCSGVYPCSTCIARRHPEICIVEPARQRRRPDRQRATVERRTSHASPSTITTTTTTTTTPHSPVRDESRSDERLSVPSASFRTPSGSEVSVGPSASAVDTSNLVTEASRNSISSIDPTSTLPNNYHPNPTITSTNVFSHWDGKVPPQPDNTRAINSMIPAHADILKFSQLYQNVFSPYIPLLPDNEDVDHVICKFLERAANRETMGVPIFDTDVTQLETAEAAMLMAILGRGAQLSDLDAATRAKISLEYSRRAFHLARLANFMLQPSLQSLQALLLLQNIMQNYGQPDAAWCLLGTLIRLAQSMGLHQYPNNAAPPREQTRSARIWAMLLWQDTSLSLCLDRPPTNMLPIHLFKTTRPTSMVLDYLEYTNELVSWCHMIMELPPETRNSIDDILTHIAELEHINARGAPHLRSRSLCQSLQSRIEHYFVRLNTALGFRLACGGALKRTGPPERAAEHANIIVRLREALQETLQSYLNLCSLTVLPLRQWSTLHETLSSAMLLEFSNLAATHRDAHDVLSRFVYVVSQHLHHNTSPENESAREESLNTSHTRALRSLRQSIDRREEALRSGQFTSPRLENIVDHNILHPTKLLSPFPMQDLRDTANDMNQPFTISFSPLLTAMPSVPLLPYNTTFAVPQDYEHLDWEDISVANHNMYDVSI